MAERTEPQKRIPKRERRRTQRRIEYAVLRVVLFFLNLLPLGLAYRLGELLMSVALLALSHYRDRVREHLDIAYGDTESDAWKARVGRDCHKYLAWYFVDVLRAPRLLRDPQWRAKVDLSQVQEVLRRDGILETSGALLIGSHQGGPEIGSLALALEGFPHAGIIRELDNPFLWQFVLREREGIGRPILTKKGALRQAFKVLRKKGMVALQNDQDSRGSGVWVPYFGRLARTHEGAATLAITAKVPVYVVSCIRKAPREFAFTVRCEGPLPFEPSGDHATDVYALTLAMTEHIEAAARAYPEQVMWAHRRWKSRPPEEIVAGGSKPAQPPAQPVART